MQDPVPDLLRPALIPELRADVAAGAPCNVQSVLISVAAVRTLPYKLAVIFYYLYLTVKTALLTVVALCVKLGIHDVVVNMLHNCKNSLYVVLHIRHFHIADSSSWREFLELCFKA